MPAGRPTDYRPEFAEQAKILCLAGATDADLADEFRVTVQTIKNWRFAHPAFFTAIKLNKPVADDQVERSLYERATGYTREAVKIFCDKDGNVTQVKYLEHVPPDSTAMIFWLKNRRPDDWREKADLNIPGLESLAERLKTAEKRTSDK